MSPEKTEKELRDLHHALDASSIVAFTDARGTITSVNDKFCEISKYSREELVGQNHRIINSGHHGRQFFVDLWKTISSGRIWSGEIKNRAKDGTFYWVFTTIVPFLSDEGKPVKYVAIRVDITVQKLLQESADAQRATLVQSERMKGVGELAAGIAHELGNPLGTIRGRMEFLRMQLKSGRAGLEETFQTIDTVEKQADRMTAIIRGMRSLSRDGTDDPHEPVAIAALIQDLLSVAGDGLRRLAIDTVLVASDDRLRVSGQEAQLSQVFVNLINNARDAVAELSERWIRIEIVDQGDAVDVVVTDSGKGIPKELRESIMKPFFTTKPMGKGSGLGLSVSRAIVEKHGGALRIDESAPNTRFIVTLPKSRKSC